MKKQALDNQRRQLLITTSAIGLAGLGLACVPFVQSMQPSARARAIGGPVEVNFGSVEEGQMLTVAWRGKPVWILRRSSATLNRLKKIGNLWWIPIHKSHHSSRYMHKICIVRYGPNSW